ncbi:toxin-antitoxin system YwqK family antitoxin [Pontibacter russatus]|uniref:hypothetical protein n=1 Tax=Pontibacter russatus TaxID=2694929 RepID=UPI001F1643D7|nr:hypothetical protein [Pontibacter russatus]
MIARIVLALFIALLPYGADAQQTRQKVSEKTAKGIWPFRINRMDKLGRYHGMWKLKGPDGETLIRKGRFRHGREVGTWRYFYYPSGRLYMLERHLRRQDFMTVQCFHENGALAREGQARVDETERDIRYYWFGSWKVYDERGEYSHSEYYEKGNLIVFR